MFTFFLWCILLIVCWPLALLGLFLYPLVWILLLPFRILGIAVDGVLECMAAARPVYEQLGAGDRLAVDYPECGHSFPAESRESAYAWLDRWLGA